jgi:hypothetical protein
MVLLFNYLDCYLLLPMGRWFCIHKAIPRHFHKMLISKTFFSTKRGWLGLTPPLFIEAPITSQDSEWACICVLGVYILPLSTIFSIEFWKCSDNVIFFFLHFICFIYYFLIDICFVKRKCSERFSFSSGFLPYFWK